jgi:hypothetical protein
MAGDNEHIQKLTTARDITVKARREVADALTQPYKRGQTENVRDMFVKLQSTIEAIDRALIHEQKIAQGGDSAAGWTLDLEGRKK